LLFLSKLFGHITKKQYLCTAVPVIPLPDMMLVMNPGFLFLWPKVNFISYPLRSLKVERNQNKCPEGHFFCRPLRSKTGLFSIFNAYFVHIFTCSEFFWGRGCTALYQHFTHRLLRVASDNFSTKDWK